MWVYVREGKAVGPDTSPHCGRVDVLLDAPLEREALWLRLVSTEIDQVPLYLYRIPTLIHIIILYNGNIWRVLYLANEPFERYWRILIWRLKH